MVRGTNSFEICSGGSGGGRDDDVNVEDEDGQEQRKGEMRGRGRGSGVFEIGSRINHSCVPNSEWTVSFVVLFFSFLSKLFIHGLYKLIKRIVF